MKSPLKKYSTLLLDLDDTLLDFKAAEYQALGDLFSEFGHPLTDDIRKTYHTLNKALWAACENGQLSRDDVLNTRFGTLFERLGRSVDGVAAERYYRDALGKGAFLMPDAKEVCAALGARYSLYIASNGVQETQEKRLAISGLDSLVQGVFVSEAIGCMKPDKGFFDYILTALPDAAPNKILMIGDSLSSDMQGGINAGIDTCWFNPDRLENILKLPVTYEIASLKELLELLMD